MGPVRRRVYGRAAAANATPRPPAAAAVAAAAETAEAPATAGRAAATAAAAAAAVPPPSASAHPPPPPPPSGARHERRSVAAIDDEYLAPPSPVRVGGVEELSRELREIAKELRQPLRLDGVWQERAAAMRRLHGLIAGGASRLPPFANLLHSHLAEPLGMQLKDLRSKCVKLACEVLIAAARSLGMAFRESAIELLPTLLRVLRVTVVVITDAADNCIRQILQHVRVPPLLPPIVLGVTARDAAPLLRARCCAYLEIILASFAAPAVDDELSSIEGALTKALSDAAADVRTAARAAFVALEARWPHRAARLRDRLPPSAQRFLPAVGGGASRASIGGGGGAWRRRRGMRTRRHALGPRGRAAAVVAACRAVARRRRHGSSARTSARRESGAAARASRPWLADRARASVGGGRGGGGGGGGGEFSVEIFAKPRAEPSEVAALERWDQGEEPDQEEGTAPVVTPVVTPVAPWRRRRRRRRLGRRRRRAAALPPST